MSTHPGNSPRTDRETGRSEAGPDVDAPGSFGRNGHGSAEAWPDPQDESTPEVGPVDPSTWNTEQSVESDGPGTTAAHGWPPGQDDAEHTDHPDHTDHEWVSGGDDDQLEWSEGPSGSSWGVTTGSVSTDSQHSDDSWGSAVSAPQGRYEFTDYPPIGGDAIGAQPGPTPAEPARGYSHGDPHGGGPYGDGQPAPQQAPYQPQAAPTATQTPADGSTEAAEPAKVTRTGKSPRKAHLQIARFEPWSVMKFSFVMSLVCFIVFFVAVFVLHLVLSGLGVFDAVSTTIRDVTAGPTGEEGPAVDPASWFALPRVLGYTALLGAVNVLLITALATVWAVIYNMASDLVGGVEVTLEEAE